MRTFRTVLEQKIWERRQTFEEFVEYAEVYAREHREAGTLGVRHLQRLAAGRGPGGRPLGPPRPATARLLEHIFRLSVDQLLSSPAQPVADDLVPQPRPVDLRQPGVGHADSPSTDLGTSFEWLDGATHATLNSSRGKVAARVGRLNQPETLDRHYRRAAVRRDELSRAIGRYYDDGDPDHGLYRASIGSATVATTVLSRDSWLGLACPLTPDRDLVALAGVEMPTAAVAVDGKVAVERLAEAALLDVRVANAPLYRLLDADVSPAAVTATVGLAPFAEYALTMDLLERELIDFAATPDARGMPLRDRYLPDLTSALDFGGRLCAGGVLGLCAIARPAGPYRDEPDYALLVQERSGQVLNAARRLAVIPKGFHQPLKDVRADARLSATLLREMEEELFGRAEVDSTAGNDRVAAPMHPRRLSEPMRWLLDQPDRMRIECTGFGVNLVSGNYEFASLIVIDDDEFWPLYGGHVEANWESVGLRLYSSLDIASMTQLISDETWSNEGLFAFLQGLQRLGEIGGRRVNLPAMTLTASGR